MEWKGVIYIRTVGTPTTLTSGEWEFYPATVPPRQEGVEGFNLF